ncbi:DUF4252 domain-containing protein [Maribacter sp. 2307UL18-2]|uniref:DUF4252 domain-containing protein n=1 Tax=Maribacter sp. 2307UL18-2 TaxID=3386274 RepID=UPI0039BD32CE
MKKTIQFMVLMAVTIFTACSSTQSLQEYYVDSSENPNFLSFDVPTSILSLEEADLTPVQKEAVESLRKLNVLAFKKSSSNGAEYEVEKTKVKAILRNKEYTELMKMNTEYGKATVKFLGDDTAIDEVIIYGNSDEKGFALIRVLGDDMNPAHLVQLLQAIQKSDFKGEGLQKVSELFKK